MTRPGAAGIRGSEALLEGEGELRKTRELLTDRASEAEAALGRAGMFGPGGALPFAHPIARATIDDELPLAKRSREPRARTLLDDPGLVGFAASTALHCARIGVLAGDLSMAEEELRRAFSIVRLAQDTGVIDVDELPRRALPSATRAISVGRTGSHCVSCVGPPVGPSAAAFLRREAKDRLSRGCSSVSANLAEED